MSTVLKRLWERGLRTGLGQKVFATAVRMDIDKAIELVGEATFDAHSSLATVQPTRSSIAGFEDLTWLFGVNPLNRGLVRMDLDEAAFLYSLVRSIPAASGVEIGRFKGGSTFLIAAALRPEGRLVSIDNHSKMSLPHRGAEFDRALRARLEQFGLHDRVELIVADSTSITIPDRTLDFVLLDGDHSYEGVRRDFENWKRALKPGGHLMLHDGPSRRPHATVHDGVVRLIHEIGRGCDFKMGGHSGSLVELVRTNSSFE